MLENAKWIACGKFETPVVERRFRLEDFSSASLYITGLGYFEAYINGMPVTNDLFLPAQTDYHARDTQKFSYPIGDTLHYRIHYLEFDVAALLRPGENVLHIVLGNGWYRQKKRQAEGNMCYGESLLARYAFRIRGEKETWICSNGSERYGETGILESNLYYGETIDARVEPRFTEQVRLAHIEGTRLVPQRCPGDRVVSAFAPRCIRRKKGACLYDAGENVTGFVEVETCLPSGAAVTLTFSENLTSDGKDLDTASTGCSGEGGQLQRDRFIGDGRPHTFQPRFCFHSFRYFEIQGDYKTVKVHVVHTDVPSLSEFTCDNPTLNWLYDAFRRTLLDNLHGCIPSDCPHRERLGYTGDGQLTAEAAMYCFDLSGAYRKWMEDIFDGQGESGHIQHTAPFQGGGGGPAGWGGAAIVLPYQYYRFYGGRDFLEENYPRMLRFVSYMRSRTEDGLIVREEEGGWCLGDWGIHTAPAIDPAFVNTCLFAGQLEMLARLAEELGRPADAEGFRAEKKGYEAAVLQNYYKEETGDFCGNVQFANVFGLALGLGREDTFTHVCEALDGCHEILDIGMFAMDLLVQILFQRKDADRALAAIELLCGQMMEAGATTVWEYPYRQELSNCHHMFCGMVRSLFSEMLGIRLHLDGRVETLPPKLPAKVGYVRAKTLLRGQEVCVNIGRATPAPRSAAG